MTEVIFFPASYNAVAVPEPIRTMDADDERVVEAESNFFEAIADSLQLSHFALASLCRLQRRMLVPSEGLGFTRGDLREPDDSINELWVDGVQPLATVLKTRDDTDWQVASFTKYPLLPQTIHIVGEFESIDDIIGGPHE